MNTINDKSADVSAKLNEGFDQPNTGNSIAIILAGGSGLTASELIPAKLGRQRPSHFCRTGGSDFVINESRKQINKVFSARETFFVVSEEHSRYYREVLKDVPSENLIVQPQNDGTTTAILYSVLKIAKEDPLAVLTFFPPDFHAANEDEFMRRVQAACAFARRDPHLILLGIPPEEGATAKNEWIELDPSARIDKNFDVWRVRRFSTQASEKRTQQLLNERALVNSSVMVGTVATFLRKISRAAPEVYERFSLAADRIGTISEQRAVRAAFYSQYPYTDFSRDVLEKSSERLMVVPVPAPLKNGIGIKQQAVSVRLPERHSASSPKYFTAQFGA